MYHVSYVRQDCHNMEQHKAKMEPKEGPRGAPVMGKYNSINSHRFPKYGVDNKSVYPCGSVVATVVRIPRSEVSERHRAGSWVWVVAKSRLEIW